MFIYQTLRNEIDLESATAKERITQLENAGFKLEIQLVDEVISLVAWKMIPGQQRQSTPVFVAYCWQQAKTPQEIIEDGLQSLISALPTIRTTQASSRPPTQPLYPPAPSGPSPS